MEKIAISLACIAIVVGLLGGYFLGYFIYEPQLQSLQNELDSLHETVIDMENMITNLNSSIETMENRSWHEVYSIEASEDITSNTFHLKGKDIRVTWIFSSLYATAELTVYMHFANGTLFAWWGDSGTWSVDNAELELVETGDYYISILSSEMISYYVAVHDYY